MEINIYLRTIQRGWWIILLVMLVALNASLLVSYLTPPVYETSSRFVVSPNSAAYSNAWDIVDSMDTLDRRSIINTYSQLLASPAVYGTSPEIQNLGEQTLGDQYNISAVVVPDTNILRLTVQGPDPKAVVQVADAIDTQALDYINRMYPVYSFTLLDKPEEPLKPIKPEPVKDASLALLVGAVLGVGLAFSREQLQYSFDRLRERSVVDGVTGALTRNQFERKLREDILQNPDASLVLSMVNFRGIEESTDVLPSAMIDRAMKKVTETLRSELRGRDIIGRWSQSQLAVLLASTPNAAIESTFKRIQNYLETPIHLSDTGDIVVRPDPCIGVVSREPFEAGDAAMERAKTAMEQASSFGAPTVVYLSTPFVLDADLEQL